MMKEKTIFNYLNSIFYKKPEIYDKKIAPAFLLSLWLSHDKSLIDIVNKINYLQFGLSDDIIYTYYYHKVPKGKRFIRWTKKEPVDKKHKDKINSIREEFSLSKREAEDMLRVFKGVL